MYKAHFFTDTYSGDGRTQTEHDPPLLFHLGHDPSEKYNIAEDHPDVIANIIQELGRHQAELIVPESQLDRN